MATYEIEIRTTQQNLDVGSPGAPLMANNLEVYNGKIGLIIPNDFPLEIGAPIEVGDSLVVRLVNDLPIPYVSGIHWHGIELQNSNDGTPVTQDAVAAGDLQQLGGVGPLVGGTYLYKMKFTRPGIFWFHAHHFHSTNRTLRGTYGMIVVTDPNEADLITAGIIPDASNTEQIVLSDITVCEAAGPTNNLGYDLSLPWEGIGVLPAQNGQTPKVICETNPIGEDGVTPAVYGAGDVPNIQTPGGLVHEGITVLANGKNVGARAGDPDTPGAIAGGAITIDVQPDQGLRLQLVNCATSRYFRLKLTDDTGFQVDLIRIGGEGGLLDVAVLEGGTIGGVNTKYNLGEILIPPASRADVVVRIPVGATNLTLWTLDFERLTFAPSGPWARLPSVPLMHFNVTGPAVVPPFNITGLSNGAVGSTQLRSANIPPNLPDLVPTLGAATGILLTPPNVACKLGTNDPNITLTSTLVPGPGNSPSINGVAGDFSGNVPYYTACHELSTRWAMEGDLLDLSVTNSTGAHHPFHLHGFSFQPISIVDGINTWTFGYREFVDNINIPNGATLNFKVQIENNRRFGDDNAANEGSSLGRWLFHCHIFFHAHRGMISELVVVDNIALNERPNIDVDGSWTYAPSGIAATRTGTYFLPDGDTLNSIVAHDAAQNPVGIVTVTPPTDWSWSSGVIGDQTEYIFVTITANSGRKDQQCFRMQIGGTDDGSDNGDPHIKTIDGTHYDFQSVGEFQLLGDRDGMVVQTRQTPVPTANPITNAYTGLTSCVSVNTAVAARVGSHYISYQPSREEGRLDFYVDGKLTALTTQTLNLDNNLVRGVLVDGKMSLRIDYEHHAVVIASPRLWTHHNFHYMNISISHTHGDEGLMGKIPNGSWLPRSGSGATFGPKPASLNDRYVELYQTFADSWRVTDDTTLFTYALGESTENYTDKDWPTFKPPCKLIPPFELPNGAQKPISEAEAKKICKGVTEADLFTDCVLDVSVTGEKSFADGYLLEQEFRRHATSTSVTFETDEKDEEKVKLTATVLTLNKDGKRPRGKVVFYVDEAPVGDPVKVNREGRAELIVARPNPDVEVAVEYSAGTKLGFEISQSPFLRIPKLIKPKLIEATYIEHRLVLKHLNQAVRVDDLIYGMPETGHSHPTEPHPEEHSDHHDEEREILIPEYYAKQIFEYKRERYPLGFRHWKELEGIKEFKPDWLHHLVCSFSNAVLGAWNDFPVDIPRRGNMSMDGIVHAIMCKSGQVLFITADQTTLLWDPEDTNPATSFEDPTNQPHTMPLGYSQVCAHHAQMSDADGSILVVGGGGYGPNPLAVAGYIFNPITKTWRRTANNMVQNKWYPTAVSLGGKKMLIASGKTNDGDMEIFDEVTETFSTMTGDDKIFPNLYPGLHILPNNSIFYSRTGFGNAGAGFGGQSFPNPITDPNKLGGLRPAYFTPNAIPNATPTGGTWTEITQSPIKRVKGMSVTLLKSTPPYTQIMVMGGADPVENDSYEIINADSLTPPAGFGPPQTFPDGEHRALPSGVLLPTGNLFVCGGISSTNSPCTEYNVETDTWSARANLGSVRQYHSAAILLPSGKVMMAGWQNPTIEIYSPPYLFQGPRPVITSVPSLVHHGANFTLNTPDACNIAKAVLVRPMAVTHQTDSEQRVIELLPKVIVDATTLRLTMPDGGHPHPMAPRGHYMLFIIDNDGIPSVAEWVFLH